MENKPVKGFLDFGRLFKHLSKVERAKRKEEFLKPPSIESKGEKENTQPPTKGV